MSDITVSAEYPDETLHGRKVDAIRSAIEANPDDSAYITEQEFEYVITVDGGDYYANAHELVGLK